MTDDDTSEDATAALPAAGDGLRPCRPSTETAPLSAATGETAPPPAVGDETAPQSATGEAGDAGGNADLAATRRHARWRRPSAIVLIVLATLLAPLTLAVLWMDHDLLNTNNYVKTVAPLSSNPAVQNAVATDLTNQLWAKVNVQQQFNGVLPSWAQIFSGPLSQPAQGLRLPGDSTPSWPRPSSQGVGGRQPQGPRQGQGRAARQQGPPGRHLQRRGEHRSRAAAAKRQGGPRRQGHPRARHAWPRTPGSTTFVLFRSENLAKAQKVVSFFHKLTSPCRCC